MLNSVLADLRDLKQDSSYYLDQNQAKQVLMTPTSQVLAEKNYAQAYFLPWRLIRPLSSAAAVQDILERFRRDPGFGENKLKRSGDWVEALAQNAHLISFPNCVQPALTVRNTSLRLLPTAKPHFKDPKLPGEGFPFDNLQNTALWANTPVLVAGQNVAWEKEGAFTGEISPVMLRDAGAAMAMSSFLTALAGTFYAQLTLFIHPKSVISLDLSFEIAFIALIGGRGSIIGPVLGALLLRPVSDFTRIYLGHILPGLHLIIFGLILILVMIYQPRGLQEPLTRLYNKVADRLAAPKAAEV